MNTDILIGAIAGDIIGSYYEFVPIKSIDFPLFNGSSSHFTDDTIMTIANADWLLTGDSLLGIMQDYGNRYHSSYGSMFYEWLRADNPQPYNSWGNGSAMRVSPIGWAFNTLEETLEAAKLSAEVTHNHPEGIKGAQATAACIYLARTGKSKQEIKEYVETTFGYNLNRTCDDIEGTQHRYGPETHTADNERSGTELVIRDYSIFFLPFFHQLPDRFGERVHFCQVFI